MNNVLNILQNELKFTGLLSLLNARFVVDSVSPQLVHMYITIPDRDTNELIEIDVRRSYNPDWSREQIIQETFTWLNAFFDHEIREGFLVNNIRYKEPH